MTKLKISATLSLPLDFVTSTQAILAQKGRGKSYCGSVQAEELLDAEQQIVIIDPTDAWFGLKSSPDGRSTGYSIPVFGGDHADLPLEVAAAEELARAIATEHFSAIVCTDNMTVGQETRFMAGFLETLYKVNRTAMHLFVDEADIFAPQKPYGVDAARVLGAMDNIVRRGRNKGIGCTLISQRAQVINKNVLSQIDQLVALGMNHPLDLDAVEDWVKRHDTRKAGKEMIESIPSLPVGDAWVWNPTLDILKRVTIRERRTFDSGATPKPGERARVAKVLAPVDLERLGRTIAASAEAAKSSDPKALKARILDLEKQLAAKKPSQAAGKERRVEVPVIKPADLKRLETLAAQCDKRAEAAYSLSGEMVDAASAVERAAASLREALRSGGHDPRVELARAAATDPPINGTRVAHPRAPQPSRRSSATPSGEVGDGGLRRMLIALAQRPAGLTNRQIGIRAGLSSKSGTFATYLSRARSQGWIADEMYVRRITAGGLAALGTYDELPTGAALGEHWLRELGGGESRILAALLEAYPSALDAKTIGERAQLSHVSGTYATYVSRLRGLELVTGRGSLRASEELFA